MHWIKKKKVWALSSVVIPLVFCLFFSLSSQHIQPFFPPCLISSDHFKLPLEQQQYKDWVALKLWPREYHQWLQIHLEENAGRTRLFFFEASTACWRGKPHFCLQLKQKATCFHNNACSRNLQRNPQLCTHSNSWKQLGWTVSKKGQIVKLNSHAETLQAHSSTWCPDIEGSLRTRTVVSKV